MTTGEKSIKNYRVWLLARLSERHKKNPAYSLRAFARIIDISPTLLSQIINGTRSLTKRTAAKIADCLELSKEESNALFSVVNGRRGDQASKLNGTVGDNACEILEVETFRVISDWYHYAILSLIETVGSNTLPEWFAKRLGISKKRAKDALERLQKLNLIKKSGKSFHRSCRSLTTTKDVPSQAIRKYHKQNLEKAREALEKYGVDKRYFGAITMAIDADDLPHAKAIIRRCQDELEALFEMRAKKDKVYTCAIQLFPVDKG